MISEFNDFNGKSQSESLAMTVNEIVGKLIAAHKDGKDVDLNKLKCAISRKHKLSRQPKLVDIIAAVPPDYKVGNNIRSVCFFSLACNLIRCFSPFLSFIFHVRYLIVLFIILLLWLCLLSFVFRDVRLFTYSFFLFRLFTYSTYSYSIIYL